MDLNDSLTRLPNRSHFLELLEAALEAPPERLNILFINLDRFQQINGALGYAAGDEVLRAVSARLRGLLEPGDVAGRVGADEFAVATGGCPDRYLHTLREPYRIAETEFFLTASIGVASFPQHGRCAVELLRGADLAMRAAKAGGRDSIEMFAPGDLPPQLDRLHLETALRRALQNGEFELMYQPVVSVHGSVDGFEALLTWRHPMRGSISPRRFIPMAEEIGLIVPIGAWVMEQACRQGARWRKAGYRKTYISVNVSARQFERRDFVAQVAGALEATRFDPECLELELTESYVMRNLPESVRRMREIRGLGISISIDDFGTGYSSLSYLSKLPVDAVKIDQSFLRRLLEPKGSLPVIQSIVRLAHDMNLSVVAEGVETEAELDMVRVLGCDKVQGHIYGQPLRREAAGALLARNQCLAAIG